MHTRRGFGKALSITAAGIVGAVLLVLPAGPASPAADGREGAASARTSVAAAATRPHIFIYHLDDLRDAFPNGRIDPMTYMPKTAQWMKAGRRYTQSFVNDPSCCPSRASMMTGRYPHNNGVLDQQDGAKLDVPHSMACYLQNAGYRTYMDGKFLTTWPKTRKPPCFTKSTVIWGGYNDVGVRVDGVKGTASGYSTTYLGNRGREYVRDALNTSSPFLLYETPQAPHWVSTTNAQGQKVNRAIPEAKYANATVAPCAGVPEADRSDKPPYFNLLGPFNTTQAQAMCTSQMRAIMSADDQFDATMKLLQDRGVLDNTLVILSSDNGYMWGEHGRWEKFAPYEPSIRTPLLVRWPAGIDPDGPEVDSTRLVTLVDILPTLLDAADIALPATAPRLDGESLLKQTSGRTTVYAEYYRDDKANPNIPSWRMIRTRTDKYVDTYDDAGTIIFREYYDLTNDLNEHTNLLGDSSTANDPPAARLAALRAELAAYATCSGGGCLR